MAVLLIKKAKFKQGLAAGFSYNQASNRITVDQSYNLVTDDKEFAGQPRAFQVNSVDEIEAIKHQIYSKPLVTVAKCSKQYSEYRGGHGSEGERVTVQRTMSNEYVVVSNTSHPEIRRVLDETFDKAKELMQQNAKFVVVFDLDESTKTWYGQVPHANSDGRSAQSTGASFYLVHNAKPQGSCAHAFFGCEQPVQKALWCVCFPCCLVTGVPYHICRSCVQNIKDVKIPALFHTNEYNTVLPPGTSLSSLFQLAPGQVVTAVVTQYPGQQYPPQQQYAPPSYSGQAPTQPGYNQPPMPMQQYPQYPQQGYQQQMQYPPQQPPYNPQTTPQYPATQY